MKKKLLAAVLVGAMAMSMAACGQKQEAAPAPAPEKEEAAEEASEAEEETAEEAGEQIVHKVAMLLPGHISDQSFNYSAYLGLMDIEAMGYEVTYVEAVADNDIESTYRTYAETDADFIIGVGWEFVDPIIPVAADYPDKCFYVYGSAPAGDVALTDNVAFSNNKEYEGAFVCGVMAGMETESNVIGFVGAAPSIPQIANVNAFRNGVASVNPDAEVKVIMTGSFDDPAAGKEAALTFVEAGADVIMHNADATGTGAIDVCVEKNIKCIGYGADQTALAPENMLCSLAVNSAKCIAGQINHLQAGDFAGIQREGLAEEVIFVPFGNVCSDESKAKCQECIDAITSGSYVVEEIIDGI